MKPLHKIKQNPRLCIGVLCAACLYLLACCPLPTLYYCNTSPSQPRGLYRVIDDGQPIRLHDLVVLRPPDDRLSVKTILKTVYALPGDTYAITDRWISVNGQPIGRVFAEDTSGAPLPKLRGSFVVPDGHFLPLAVHVDRSYDGRYFGAVAQSEIIQKVAPLLLWED